MMREGEVLISAVWMVRKREPMGRRTRMEGMATTSEMRRPASGKAWRMRKTTVKIRKCDFGRGGELTWHDERFHEDETQDGQSCIVGSVADDELGAGEHEPEDREERDHAPASETDGVDNVGGFTYAVESLRKDLIYRFGKLEKSSGLVDGDGDAESEGEQRHADEIAHEAPEDRSVVDFEPSEETAGLDVKADDGEEQCENSEDHVGDGDAFEGGAVSSCSDVIGETKVGRVAGETDVGGSGKVTEEASDLCEEGEQQAGMEGHAALLVGSQGDDISQHSKTETEASASGNPVVGDDGCPVVNVGPRDLIHNTCSVTVVDRDRSEGIVIPAPSESIDGAGDRLAEGKSGLRFEGRFAGGTHLRVGSKGTNVEVGREQRKGIHFETRRCWRG
jgi:hypothetical protein